MKLSPASIIIALVIATITTTLQAPIALACMCGNLGTPSTALSQASAVFSGEVQTIDPDSAEYSKYAVTFAVDKIWKGISDDTVTISTGRGGGDCGYHFIVGEQYLVYASGDTQLNTSSCSRTALLAKAEEDLTALGLDTTRKLILLASGLTTGLIVIIYAIIRSRKKLAAKLIPHN